MLFISGSVEINPGPPSPKEKELSFAVWNLDSLPVRDFARIPLVESLQSTYDIFGMCESMLSDSISNEEIFIDGFPLISSGQTKLLTLEILSETIVAEINLNRKKYSLLFRIVTQTCLLMSLLSIQGY